MRRNFLVGAGATAITVAVGGFLGRRLIDFQRSAESRSVASVLLEKLAPATNKLPINGTYDHINGVAKFVTSNENFYLIDTALIKPTIDHRSWSLKVKGMVDKELKLSYEDVIKMGLVEEMVTLSCVSNPIGGNLVGNAIWRGVPLKKILDLAGASKNNTQIVGRSKDGWTSGFPTSIVYEPDRVCLVALEMNGEPLPKKNGFPARLVVAGLYGYVSATKWLTEIEVTDMSFDSYWVPRGWSKQGPIKTQSRIDIPKAHQKLSAGTNSVAGIAWAPNKGIEKVEVKISTVTSGVLSDSPWQKADLSTDLTNTDWNKNSWCQWHLPWVGENGDYEITVRATDGDGITQTPEVTTINPNGASGWDRIRVRVR